MNQIFIIILILIALFSPNIILIGVVLYVSYLIIPRLINSNQIKFNKPKHVSELNTEFKQKPEIIKQYIIINDNNSNTKNLNNIIRNNNKNIFN
jgi:hypothetical protein